MESMTFWRHRRPLSEAAIRLKALRMRTGLSVQQLANLMRMPKSSYANYENRYFKPFLPVWLVNELAPILARYGIPTEETLALGGLVVAERPTEEQPPAKPAQHMPAQHKLVMESRRVRSSFLDRSILLECLTLYLEGLERTPKARGWTASQKAKGFVIVYERFLAGRLINETAMREEIDMLP